MPPAEKNAADTGVLVPPPVVLVTEPGSVGRAGPGGRLAAKFYDLPLEARQRLDKLLQGILSEGVAALTDLGESLDRGDASDSPDEARALRDLMPSLVKLVPALHQGLLIRPLWKEPGEIHRIARDLEAGAEGFETHGHARLACLARSLQLWATAFLELQELKTDNFEVKRRKAREILRAAEEFGAEVGQTTLFLEPFLFMMAGERALGERDGVTAGALMEQAAQAAASAETELTAGAPPDQAASLLPIRNTYQGMVSLYAAVNRFAYARILFDRFDFDSLADEPLDREARDAVDKLSHGIPTGDFATLTHYSEALLSLLRATNQFAKLIQTVFHSTYTGNPKELRALKQGVRDARKAVIQAGLEFRSLVEYCDDLTTQVNNVARLATPTGKDFGKFSGLVAAAVFLPAVLVLGFANEQFSLGLDARTLFEYSLLLGLVAGFGLAALKFTPNGLLNQALPGLDGKGAPASGKTPPQ